MPGTTSPAAAAPAASRAAVLPRPHTITLMELAIPQPGGREVLVEVAAVEMCGSDVYYYEEGRIGNFMVRTRLVLGHEASGVVVACGPHADRLEPGTLVAIEPGVPCRHCTQCRAGRYNLCPQIRFLAAPPVHGPFARYLAVPEDFCYPVPPSLSADTAAVVEPLSVGVWACRKAAVGLGDRVLATGAGPIGLLTALVARAAAAVPTICNINPQPLARAREFGIGQAVDLRDSRPEDLVPYDVFIECSGADGAAAAGLAALLPAGKAVLVGMSAAGGSRSSAMADTEPRTGYHRQLPVREHLSGCHRTRRLWLRTARRPHRRRVSPRRRHRSPAGDTPRSFSFQSRGPSL